MIQKREIQIADDLPFTRKSWKVERLGWMLLALFLLAGVLGALGPGLLSGVKAGGPLLVEYDRFGRYETPGALRVRLPKGARNLWIENRWLKDVEVQSVRPEPVRVEARPGWTVYSFVAEEDVEARLDVVHHSSGRVEGRFGVSPDRAVRVSQFVYP